MINRIKNFFDDRRIKRGVRNFIEREAEYYREHKIGDTKELWEILKDVYLNYKDSPRFKEYTFKRETQGETEIKGVPKIDRIIINHERNNVEAEFTMQRFISSVGATPHFVVFLDLNDKQIKDEGMEDLIDYFITDRFLYDYLYLKYESGKEVPFFVRGERSENALENKKLMNKYAGRRY